MIEETTTNKIQSKCLGGCIPDTSGFRCVVCGSKLFKKPFFKNNSGGRNFIGSANRNRGALSRYMEDK